MVKSDGGYNGLAFRYFLHLPSWAATSTDTRKKFMDRVLIAGTGRLWALLLLLAYLVLR